MLCEFICLAAFFNITMSKIYKECTTIEGRGVTGSDCGLMIKITRDCDAMHFVKCHYEL